MNGTSGLQKSTAFDPDPSGAETPPELRPVLAVREFVRGNLALRTAADLAGMPEPAFVGLLSRLDLSDFREAPDESGSADGGRGPSPRLSVVIPLHNEEENLATIHDRLSSVLAGLGSYEIIFVDDGSQDASAEIVGDLQRRDPAVRLVQLTRNFGKEAALSAGLDRAAGEAVIVMDADLQDPPELLPELVKRWEAGYHVAYAVRTKRKEVWWKRAGYHCFYRLLRFVADIDIPLDAGDFCLMDRRVVDVLRALPEKNRFLRGLRSWAGFRQVGVAYDRPPRIAGDAKFGLRALIKVARDGMVAFTSLPLRLAAYVGFLTAGAGVAYLGVAFYARLFTDTTPPGWTTLVAIVLILGGMQLLVTGVLGTYIARIYDESKNRPMYLVDETLEDKVRTRA